MWAVKITIVHAQFLGMDVHLLQEKADNMLIAIIK
jgi:hypothetical protein